jgi:hypothetical protein
MASERVFAGRAVDVGSRGGPSTTVGGLHAHRRAAIFEVGHVDAPGLAAHLTVLDVLLRRATARIQRHRAELAAVRTCDLGLGVRHAVAEWELLVQRLDVVRVLVAVVALGVLIVLPRLVVEIVVVGWSSASASSK